MTPDQALELLVQAGQDEEKLALASIEISIASHSAETQAQLRDIIRAAAVPHWFDVPYLRHILKEIPLHRLQELYPLVQNLAFVEPFPSRDGFNIHERTRQALLRQFFAEDVETFTRWSKQSGDYFSKMEATHATIESIYHYLTGDPPLGAEKLGQYFDDWYESGRVDKLQALAVMLDEHLSRSWLKGLALAMALDVSATVQQSYRPAAEIERRLLGALRLYREHDRIDRESAVLDELGILNATEGSYKKALEYYENALELSERRLELEPNSIQRQRDVAGSHSFIGDMLFELDRIPEAIDAYNRSWRIREKLVDAHPNHHDLLRDLSVSYDQIGKVCAAQGNNDLALSYFRFSLAICVKLAQVDPDNVQWQHDLAVSHDIIGENNLLRGFPEAALESFDSARKIYEKILAVASFELEWWDDLACCYDQMGESHLRLQQAEKALGLFRQAEAIFQKLVSGNNSNSDWREKLISVSKNIARAVQIGHKSKN